MIVSQHSLGDVLDTQPVVAYNVLKPSLLLFQKKAPEFSPLLATEPDRGRAPESGECLSIIYILLKRRENKLNIEYDHSSKWLFFKS